MISASVERAFSIADSIATKRKMRTAGHNVHAQLMVQANWNIAQDLLPEVLAMGPRAWRREENERIERTTSDPVPGKIASVGDQ
jgi:hypothetical protein